MEVAPDGSMMLVARRSFNDSDDVTLELWTTRPLRRVRALALPGESLKFGAAAFSPGGRYLAIGLSSGTVTLWNARSGQFLRRINARPLRRDPQTQMEEYRGGPLAFGRDGRTIAACSTDDERGNEPACALWNVSGRLKRRFALPKYSFGVAVVALSPDGKTLVAGASNGTPLYFWNARSGKLKGTLNPDVQDGESNALAFSPDGRLLACGSRWSVSASSRAELHVWKWPSRKLLWKKTGAHRLFDTTSVYDSLMFSRDGKILACGDNNATVELRNARTGKLLRTLRGRPNRLDKPLLLPSPDGFAPWALHYTSPARSNS